MDIFTDDIQNNFEADFGFTQHRTKALCKNPVFSDKKLHRIAIMKDFHIGSPGDIDECGIPGWVTKFVCTGCGKRFRLPVGHGTFYPGI